MNDSISPQMAAAHEVREDNDTVVIPADLVRDEARADEGTADAEVSFSQEG